MWALQGYLLVLIWLRSYSKWKKVNSQKLKLPSGKILKGDERKQFELDRIKIVETADLSIR